MTVTVTGDRQTGKSYMLTALADKLIRRGQKVLYVSSDMNTARERLYDMEQDAEWRYGHKVYRGNGQERIVDESSGGVVYFSSARSNNRGLVFDTLILDDGVDPSLPEAYSAKFVYRAELSVE